MKDNKNINNDDGHSTAHENNKRLSAFERGEAETYSHHGHSAELCTKESNGDIAFAKENHSGAAEIASEETRSESDAETSSKEKQEESVAEPAKERRGEGAAARGGKRRGKKKRRVPLWLSWGLTILFLSFALSVLFSFLTEISVNGSPFYVCLIVLLVLLVLNIGCDIIANAVVSCEPEGFNAMASRKIRGAKRAVTFCRNSEKIASIFSDVVGDICGIISGSAGAVLAGYYVFNDSIEGMIISILISAVIGALTVGGKAFGKPISIKYNFKITFGFAKFTTFFVKEK